MKHLLKITALFIWAKQRTTLVFWVLHRKVGCLKQEEKFHMVKVCDVCQLKVFEGQKCRFVFFWKFYSIHFIFIEMLFSTERKHEKKNMCSVVTFSKWNYSIFQSRFSIWIFFSLHSFLGGGREVHRFQNYCNWKEMFQIEYINNWKSKWETVIRLSTLFFLTLFWFWFFLSLVFISLWNCQQHCQEDCILLMYYKMLLEQNSRDWVNFLHMVSKSEQKHLQWKCPKLFWLHSYCNLITYLGLKKTIQFCCTSWIAAQTTCCCGTKHFSLCFIPAKGTNEPLDFINFFSVSDEKYHVQIVTMLCSQWKVCQLCYMRAVVQAVSQVLNMSKE